MLTISPDTVRRAALAIYEDRMSKADFFVAFEEVAELYEEDAKIVLEAALRPLFEVLEAAADRASLEDAIRRLAC